MATFYGGEQLVNVFETVLDAGPTVNPVYTVPAGRYAEIEILYSNSDSELQVKRNGAGALLSNASFFIRLFDPQSFATASAFYRYVFYLSEGDSINQSNDGNAPSALVSIKEYKKP